MQFATLYRHLVFTVCLVLPATGAWAQNIRHDQMLEQATAAYQSGDFQEVLEVAEQVIAEDARNDQAWYFRASAKVELGTASSDAVLIREGVEDSREAIRIGGADNPEYYFPYLFGMTNLSRVENQPHHAEVALTVIDEELRVRINLTPDQRANLLFHRARVNNQLGHQDEAIADLDRALDAVPTHLSAMTLKCDLASRSGNNELALATYAQAIEAHPENPVVQNNYGLYLFQLGRGEEAIERFTAAVDADDSYFMGYTNRGYVLLMRGEVERAEADFTQSLAINPRHPVALRFRGESHLRQSETEAAVADYQGVVRLQPQSADAHAELGFALLFAGQAETACDEFQQALQLNANYQFLNPWLCLALVENGEVDAARDAMQAAIDKPEEQRQWYDMVTLYLLGEINDGELLGAVNPNDEAVSRSQQCEAFFFIGRKLQSEGMNEEATAFFEQALQVGTPRLTAYRGALQQ